MEKHLDNAAPQVSTASPSAGEGRATGPLPAVAAPDNAGEQVTGNSSPNSSSMENRLDLSAPAAPSAPADDGHRPATLAEALSVTLARLHDQMSPAERRELREAIDALTNKRAEASMMGVTGHD